VTAPSSSVPPIDRLVSSVKWMNPEEFLSGGGELPAPLWRALLLTDGSTTLFLQALCRTPVTLEMIDQHTAPLPPSLTGWLDGAANQPVLQRRVWLTDGRNRLALGYALISLERLSPALRDQLAEGTRPIGLLADEVGRPSLRDRLQVGRLTDRGLARRFGPVGADTDTFWCRRYCLRIPNAMTAVIIEILSPMLDGPSSS